MQMAWWKVIVILLQLFRCELSKGKLDHQLSTLDTSLCLTLRTAFAAQIGFPADLSMLAIPQTHPRLSAIGKNFPVRFNARPSAIRLEAASQRNGITRIHINILSRL
jgi:hypothetical protein